MGDTGVSVCFVPFGYRDVTISLLQFTELVDTHWLVEGANNGSSAFLISAKASSPPDSAAKRASFHARTWLTDVFSRVAELCKTFAPITARIKIVPSTHTKTLPVSSLFLLVCIIVVRFTPEVVPPFSGVDFLDKQSSKQPWTHDRRLILA